MHQSCSFSRKVRELLHCNGVRATLARIKIFSELTKTGDPLFSVDDIYQRLQIKNEIIAFSTVHKTLKKLCQFGLLLEDDTSLSGTLLFKKTTEFAKFQSTL